MNFILAFIIYIGVLYAWGETYLPTANVKYGIEVDSVGMQIGLQNGDKILSVDNKPVENFRKVIPTVILDKAHAIQVERNGQKVDVEISDDDLALLIKSKGVIAYRIPYNYTISSFAKNSAAKDAGLKTGDQILGMDSLKFEYNDQFRTALRERVGKTISLQILRDGKESNVSMLVPESAALGIVLDLNLEKIFELKTTEYSLFESIPAGFDRGITTINDYLKQFKLIFSPKTKAYESLGGFIAIGNIFPGAWNWFDFWNMTAFLSIILGVMNLLPIPALDGGHVIFLLFEMVTGRKPGDKFLEYAQIAGMVLLLSLVLYANGNDIFKLFK
jgi:regulator of sigma E protease